MPINLIIQKHVVCLCYFEYAATLLTVQQLCGHTPLRHDLDPIDSVVRADRTIHVRVDRTVRVDCAIHDNVIPSASIPSATTPSVLAPRRLLRPRRHIATSTPSAGSLAALGAPSIGSPLTRSGAPSVESLAPRSGARHAPDDVRRDCRPPRQFISAALTTVRRVGSRPPR
jgi:hypothetical protein